MKWYLSMNVVGEVMSHFIEFSRIVGKRRDKKGGMREKFEKFPKTDKYWQKVKKPLNRL